MKTLLKSSYSIIITLLISHGITAQTITWLGTTDSEWHTPTNWMPTGIPTATDEVLINSSPNDPMITAKAVARTINIGSDASLTVNDSLIIKDAASNFEDPIYNHGINVNTDGLLTNTVNGVIHIDNTLGSGIVTNGIVENQNQIKISNTQEDGIVNSFLFTNLDSIEIGGVGAVIGIDGIFNFGDDSVFLNSPNGYLQVDNSQASGITNQQDASLNNEGKISIGTKVVNGTSAIMNVIGGTINNFSEINILNSSEDGISNIDGTFNNYGSLSVGGDNAFIGFDAINNINSSTFINHECAIISLFDRLNNASTIPFINDGLIYFFTTETHIPGLFQNNGAITDEQGTFPIDNPGFTNNGIIINPAGSLCGIVRQAFNVVSTDKYEIEGVYTDDTFTAFAGTYDGATDVFTVDPNISPGTYEFQVIFQSFKFSNGNLFIEFFSTPWIVEVSSDTITFTGNSDAFFDWHEPENWDLGIIPEPCHHVIIPSPHDVQIFGSNEGLGKTLDVQLGAGIETQVAGLMDITNN